MNADTAPPAPPAADTDAGEPPAQPAKGLLAQCWRCLGEHPHLVLGVAVIVCYAPNLTGYFIQDAFTVLPRLRALALPEFAETLVGAGRRWRFLWWVAVYAEARLLPLVPLPHILWGVGLFGALVCCVHAINRRLVRAPGAALAATLIFTLLPQHQGRVFTMGKSFVYLCFAVTVWCFTHAQYPQRRWLVWVGVAALVGTLMSYEPNLFVAAPIVAVSVLLRRCHAGRWSGLELAWRIGPATVCTLAYAVIRFGVLEDFGGQNFSLTGESTSVLAQRGSGVLVTIGARLLSGIRSDLGLLDPAHHPMVGHIGGLYAGAAALLLVSGTGWRRTWPAALWLGAWWVASFVPLIDVLPQPNPESWYFFWPTWPFALLLAAVGPDPVRTRRGAWLWTACVGAVLVAALSETLCWRTRFTQARTMVTTFHASVPPPHQATGVYVLDAPGVIADFLMFPSLSDALLFPYGADARSRLAVWPERTQPQHLPALVPDRPPVEHVSRILVRRWNAAEQRWAAETLPSWAHPRAAETPDLAAWTCPPDLELQGWKPNPHVVSLRKQGDPCLWQVVGPYPLLFGDLPPAEPAPIAYAEVTMAVRSPSPLNHAEWLFLTPAQPTYGGDRVERFRVTADGAPHTYAVPLLHNPAAVHGGPIADLALRPAGVAGAVVRIDGIRLIPWKAGPQSGG